MIDEPDAPLVKLLSKGRLDKSLDLFCVQSLGEAKCKRDANMSILGMFTLLPVATELVGSRPAYRGVFSLVVLCLLCCREDARSHIGPCAIIQRLLLNAHINTCVANPRRQRTWHQRISAFGNLSKCGVT